MTEDKLTRDEALAALRELAELGRDCAQYQYVLESIDEIADALSAPTLDGVIRVVRLGFARHIEGHFFFNDYICLPEDAAPAGVNRLTTLAYIVEEAINDRE